MLRKGFKEIIEALGIVKRQRSDFHLRIVGYGRAEDDIRKVLEEHGVSDHVSFLGRVEYKDIAEYYLSSDAYLFYGAREGSSLAMIEAAAYGLPLIASDHPGKPNVRRAGKRAGFVMSNTASPTPWRRRCSISSSTARRFHRWDSVVAKSRRATPGRTSRRATIGCSAACSANRWRRRGAR